MSYASAAALFYDTDSRHILYAQQTTTKQEIEIFIGGKPESQDCDRPLETLKRELLEEIGLSITGWYSDDQLMALPHFNVPSPEGKAQYFWFIPLTREQLLELKKHHPGHVFSSLFTACWCIVNRLDNVRKFNSIVWDTAWKNHPEVGVIFSH